MAFKRNPPNLENTAKACVRCIRITLRTSRGKPVAGARYKLTTNTGVEFKTGTLNSDGTVEVVGLLNLALSVSFPDDAALGHVVYNLESSTKI